MTGDEPPSRFADRRGGVVSARLSTRSSSHLEGHGRTNLVAAIRRILAGERNEQSLCAPLDADDSIIIESIPRAIADPTTLSALLTANGADS